MSSTVYIAAKFQDQAVARDVASHLRVEGIHVNASWLELGNGHSSDEFRARMATRDLADIDSCDIVVLLPQFATDFSNADSHAKAASGGCHFETGYAFAKGKKLIVVGERRNVFHYHPSVHHLTYSPGEETMVPEYIQTRLVQMIRGEL